LRSLWLLEVVGCAALAGPGTQVGALAEPGRALALERCMRATGPRPDRRGPMAPATGGGDGEPGSATAPAGRKLIFGSESWRELARGSWSHRDLWFGTVAVPGFDGDWARLSDEIMRRSHAPWSGLDWEAKLSHLKDLHTRLAAVDLDAAQLAGEAAHDLVEALLRLLAAELRGSGLATPPRSPRAWWPTCRLPPPSAWAPTSGCPSSRWPDRPGRRTA
jgi:hypothetical protein